MVTSRARGSPFCDTLAACPCHRARALAPQVPFKTAGPLTISWSGTQCGLYTQCGVSLCWDSPTAHPALTHSGIVLCGALALGRLCQASSRKENLLVPQDYNSEWSALSAFNDLARTSSFVGA